MSDWRKALPMRLTMSRIALTVPAVILLHFNTFWANLAAAAIFIIASITDYWDGYYARKFNAVSNMGKFMDPIADKILVTGILTMLILPGKVDAFLVILLTVRDTYISGIRAVAAADGVVIAAKAAGKWKTALQMGAIPAVILGDLSFLPGPEGLLGRIGSALLWISVALSISSGIQYYLAYRAGQREHRRV